MLSGAVPALHELAEGVFNDAVSLGCKFQQKYRLGLLTIYLQIGSNPVAHVWDKRAWSSDALACTGGATRRLCCQASAAASFPGPV